jgi:FkbM family methyltransferase
MKVSSRAMLQRLVTYPWLVPIMPLYNLASDKKSFLNTFYLIRGFPHGYLRDRIRIASYGGLKIAFPYEEDPSFDDVWLRDVYFPYQPRGNDVVMDVGAHMGFFTLKVAREVAKVIAVEPDPANFRLLVFNVKVNGLDQKVCLENSAVGERDGSIFLDRGGYGVGRTKATSERTECEVNMKAVDSLVDESGLDRLDLIKVDTEGYELKVLKGARSTLRKFKPRVLLAAYHFYKEHVGLVDYLRKLNYVVEWYRVPLFLSGGSELYLYAHA